MMLLCNTFITETPPRIGKGYVNRENLKSFSNFDIFKYSLASLSRAHKWTRAVIKIELDTIYTDRKDELESFIRTEFSGVDLMLFWTRNIYQQDWIDTYELLNDRIIWFYCNHDHIFMDSSPEYLNSLVSNMSDELCSIGFSHWPECIRTAKLGITHGHVSNSYKFEKGILSYKNRCFDSIMIITRELYKEWWLTGNFNQYKLPRPDYFGLGLAEIKQVPVHTMIIPLKELCRHFDGYQHCSPPISNEKCPALDIPIGFFDYDMKINYGFDYRDETKININPRNPDYFAHSPTGTDYKITLQDIPHFWKPRISEYIIADGIDTEYESMLQHSIKSIYESILYNGFTVDSDVLDEITRLQLTNHGQYEYVT